MPPEAPKPPVQAAADVTLPVDYSATPELDPNLGVEAFQAMLDSSNASGVVDRSVTGPGALQPAADPVPATPVAKAAPAAPVEPAEPPPGLVSVSDTPETPPTGAAPDVSKVQSPFGAPLVAPAGPAADPDVAKFAELAKALGVKRETEDRVKHLETQLAERDARLARAKADTFGFLEDEVGTDLEQLNNAALQGRNPSETPDGQNAELRATVAALQARLDAQDAAGLKETQEVETNRVIEDFKSKSIAPTLQAKDSPFVNLRAFFGEEGAISVVYRHMHAQHSAEGGSQLTVEQAATHLENEIRQRLSQVSATSQAAPAVAPVAAPPSPAPRQLAVTSQTLSNDLPTPNPVDTSDMTDAELDALAVSMLKFG